MLARLTRIVVPLLAVVTCGLFVMPSGAAAQAVDRDEVYESATGTTLEMLLDESNLGGSEVEVGVLTFQPGSESAAHVHQSTEIFYVLEGQLEHIVNGQSYLLEPGMMGWVRAPDRVTHKVSEEAGPTRVLVIWAPGGEAAGITGNWDRRR